MSTALPSPFEAARTKAVVCRRPEIRTLQVMGPDRTEFLDGMLSQDVRALQPGQGARALKCSAKGRIEAYLRVRAEEAALSLDVRAEVSDRLKETLLAHIVMEDCTVLDTSETREVLSLLGPSSYACLEAIGLGAINPELPPGAFERVGANIVIAEDGFGLPGYELHVPAGSGEKRAAALVRAGAMLVEADVLEVLRIEAGEPRDGAELDLETLPMEARLERAVSFTKGCYVGQEVVARGTNLGQVNHLLVGLRLGGGPPSKDKPAALSLDGRPVGEIESFGQSAMLGACVGLGYVRREHEAAGTLLSYEAASGAAEATVLGLPMIPPLGASS